jgi:phospholipase C
MTAMRMAQNNEPPTPVNNTANPASTYQTATPQQLQAAGIQPVVINDRTTTSIRPNNRPAGRSTLIVQNITPLNNFSRNEFTNRSAINELSPYHQQLLSRNNPTASSSSIPPQVSNYSHII